MKDHGADHLRQQQLQASIRLYCRRQVEVSLCLIEEQEKKEDLAGHADEDVDHEAVPLLLPCLIPLHRSFFPLEHGGFCLKEAWIVFVKVLTEASKGALRGGQCILDLRRFATVFDQDCVDLLVIHRSQKRQRVDVL